VSPVFVFVIFFHVFFRVSCGIRQGGVLSPFLFAVYVDDIVRKVDESDLGCRIGLKRIAIILYADDILLLAPSVDSLQKLVHIVELELFELDMSLNTKKSVCIRFGPRYQSPCCSLKSIKGDDILWVASCRYLGVWLKASRQFKIDLTHCKKSFFRAVNSLLSKVLRIASEETMLHLISTKCVPILLYGLDACSLNVADKRSLDFIQTRLLMKLFNTSSTDIVNECRVMFNIQSVSSLIVCRRQKFLTKFLNIDNFVCSSVLGCARRDLNDLI